MKFSLNNYLIWLDAA